MLVVLVALWASDGGFWLFLLALAGELVEEGFICGAHRAGEDLRVVERLVGWAVPNSASSFRAGVGVAIVHRTGRALRVATLTLALVGLRVDSLTDGASLAFASSWVPYRPVAGALRAGLGLRIPDRSIGRTQRSLTAIIARPCGILAFHLYSIESLPGQAPDHALVPRSIEGGVRRAGLALLDRHIIERTVRRAPRTRQRCLIPVGAIGRALRVGGLRDGQFPDLACLGDLVVHLPRLAVLMVALVGLRVVGVIDRAGSAFAQIDIVVRGRGVALETSE